MCVYACLCVHGCACACANTVRDLGIQAVPMQTGCIHVPHAGALARAKALASTAGPGLLNTNQKPWPRWFECTQSACELYVNIVCTQCVNLRERHLYVRIYVLVSMCVFVHLLS